MSYYTYSDEPLISLQLKRTNWKILLQQFICLQIIILLSFATVMGQDQKEGFNYDESKVGDYSLPNVLLTASKTVVSTTKDWEMLQRPEILHLFEEHVYGYTPKAYDKIQFHVKNENSKAMDGRAHLKEVEIMVFKNNKSVILNLTLFTPNNLKESAPVFLLINNRSKRNTASERDTISGFWPAEKIINAGYAIAAFQVDDAAPDNKNSYQNAALQLYPELLQADNGMKAIGAWAWAASRVMDYFEKDSSIDRTKVAVVGHSRGGKAALWAAAIDNRFAICFSNNSGNTGTKLSRRNFGETVKRINTNFPHWFNNNYKKYNNNENALPVDQHMLIALIAPRPIYATSASKDLWGDPKGMFLALKSAEPVYALYGLESKLPKDQPQLNTPTINSALGYHIRDGIHDLTEYDWDNFIKFANFQYK